jgi:hypothetical protein
VHVGTAAGYPVEQISPGFDAMRQRSFAPPDSRGRLFLRAL